MGHQFFDFGAIGWYETLASLLAIGGMDKQYHRSWRY